MAHLWLTWRKAHSLYWPDAFFMTRSSFKQFLVQNTTGGCGHFPAPQRGGTCDVALSRCWVTRLRILQYKETSSSWQSTRNLWGDTLRLWLFGGPGAVLDRRGVCPATGHLPLELRAARPSLRGPFPRQTRRPNFKRRRFPWGSGACSWSAWAGPEGRGGSPHAFRKKPTSA